MECLLRRKSNSRLDLKEHLRPNSGFSLIPQMKSVIKSYFSSSSYQTTETYTRQAHSTYLFCSASTIVTLYAMDSQRPRYTLSPKLPIVLPVLILVLTNFCVELLLLSLFTGCLSKKIRF